MGLNIYQSRTLDTLVDGLRKNDNRSQKAVYERFSPVMFSVSLRYVKDYDSAQDVLLKSFMKVFDNIRQYTGQGSFEGWVRRIVVNEALMYLRKHKNMSVEVDIEEAKDTAATTYDHLEAEELLSLVQQLPVGYRTVFNLYAIEGYTHAEIAEKLNISEGTSKSQLSRAKQLLRQMLDRIDPSYQDQIG
ncbi:RNA polymerase sigma factor [Tunicatimonas pelagia]|uniref:RNA polymerase sigma factor n=1 Tax=Tunicatimonas pelagia TaxID=931531 RepID=UPI002665C2A5|nr:sigma-70 family RNA polymerase sigma factor [Tunicatimonas pelagia]WKN40548.1 sigma-70 family RNA polymerase sigma factor [Tunicatimonas pelagia]